MSPATAKYKPYTSYKSSGIEWLYQIPEHWGEKRFKFIFRIEKRIAGKLGYDVISITQNGFRIKDIESGVGQLSMDYSKYQMVEVGDFAMNHMDLLTGGVDIATYKGVTSPDYRVFTLKDKECDERYLLYVMRLCFSAHIFYAHGQGSSHLGRWRFPTDNFKKFCIPIPPKKEQTVIAHFLDRETARIDQLIEKKQRLVEYASLRIEASVDRAISDTSIPNTRFEYLVNRVSRPVELSEHEKLVRLGLYNRGRGIFKKPAADEEGMGSSDFHFIKSGDLIISGQFAWEGAVAMATEEEAGCVVSHRYPVYRAVLGVNTAYLLGFLRTKLGDFLLNDCSRGSAGRNRPLNTWRLGKEKIPVPENELQEEVERAVVAHRKIKAKTEASIRKLNEFRSALITAAVTGQIDVNEWSRRGHSDAKLDAIAKEMES